MKKVLSLFALLMTIVIGAWAGTTPDYESYDWSSDDAAANVIGTHGDITISKAGLGNNGQVSGHWYIPVNQNLKNSDSAWKYLGISATKQIEKIDVFYCENGTNSTNVAWVAWGKGVTPEKKTLAHGETDATTGAKDWDNRKWVSIDLSGTEAYTVYLSRSVREFQDSEGKTLSNFGAGQTFNILGLRVYLKAPAIGPTITTQPQDAEYEIGTTTYPSMSVEATTSAGSLTYEWRWGPDGENYAPFPSGKVPSSRTATLSIEEVIGMLQPTGDRTLYIECSVSDDDASVNSDAAILTIKAPFVGPTITTQPQNASFTVGDATYPSMSVAATASAGELTYKWFGKVGEEWTEAGVTTAELSLESFIGNLVSLETYGNFEFKCQVTDDNGTIDSDVATLTINAAPTISIAADKAIALKGGTAKLTATVNGYPNPTIQWYSKNGELIVPIEGATNAEYTASFTEYGTKEFIAKATNSVGAADSEPVSIIVKLALQNVEFSNGVFGAIAEPTAAGGDLTGTIEVPYINGQNTPIVDQTSLQAFNAEASFDTEENTITVTSGDYTAVYSYGFVPVNPIAVTADIAETNFTEDEESRSWVFNKYGYDATKGLKFAKAVDEANNLRIAKGNTRQYYFVGPAKSMTLTKIGSTRKVNVYVNGEKVIADTNNDALGDITLSPIKDNLVIVEAAAGTSGDGGFSAYSIKACDVKPEITTQPENVEYEAGSTTYPSMSVEATATSGDLVYQWEFSQTGDANDYQAIPAAIVPSAAAATLLGSEVFTALSDRLTAGTYYARCRITDADGTAYSDVATVTIVAVPTITTQPQDVNYVVGSQTCADMTIAATPVTEGDDLSYQWQVSLNGEEYTNIPSTFVPSAATATLLGTEAIALLDNLDPKPEKVYIKCVVSEAGCDDATSEVATVYMVSPEDVTETETWDWSNVTGSGSGSELPAGKKNIDIIISDAPDFTPGTGFSADKLVLNGQYAWRDANSSKFTQANYLKFNTTVTGYVQVEFANTGNNAARTVTINGNADGQEVTNNSSYATSKSTFVEAGEVVIAGIQTAAGEDEGKAKMLRIRKVTFTPGAAPVIVDDPVITPAGGQFISNVTVKASCATVGAAVLYSSDGETWTEVPADGIEISNTSSLSFKATKEGMTDSQIIPLTFTKVETTAQTTVSEATTWDWSAITASDLELKDDGTTLPSKNDDFVTYGDIAEFNSASLPAVFGNNIAFKGKYPYRKSAAQEGSVRLVFGVDGAIYVDFSDTGKTIPEGGAVKRYLNVNGANTEFYTQRNGTDSDPKTNCKVDVVAGEVILTGMGEDGTTPQSICIKKIVFTPSTGINGVAEDAEDAENANVKIIKNGNLYIGKFNIAGQQVK